ncbi:MAG: cytochrome d ubiquinol oxidase subunit II [Bacteroidales bacterium]
METLHFLQQYWWVLVSLLGALLVFLLFVQGGQTMIYGTAKTEDEKKYLISVLGHKWEITFTTLVTFGGAAFASFPLFYSTSFGGAYWLWLSILFLFVVQAVSYEFRNKTANLLGARTYDLFLFLNGMFGTILLGVAVGTLFSGGAYSMDKLNITEPSNPTISYWTNDWMGLDAIANSFNLLLGFVVFFAARTLGLLFILGNKLPDNFEAFKERASIQLKISGVTFVLLFVAFLVTLLLKTGYSVNPESGIIMAVPYKYFFNFIELLWPLVLLLFGVVLVLVGLVYAMFVPKSAIAKKSFYITGAGVVLAVWPILICAALNNTAYFPSLVNIQDSLTLYNSSSSLLTLTVMAYVSLAIPFVLAYIVVVWRKMGGEVKY